MTVILEGAGFLMGAVVLGVAFTATCFGVTVGVEVVETEAGLDVDPGGFPAVEVVITGVEFTSTGSVEGIGLPSLV